MFLSLSCVKCLVILSEAKDLCQATEMFRFAQHDNAGA